MIKYLLDSNHLSPGPRRSVTLVDRMRRSLRLGNRFGTIVQALFEVESGMAGTLGFGDAYSAMRQRAGFVKLWPLGPEMAATYGDIFLELRRKGRVLSQIDMMLATMARHRRMTLLTTDRDFEALPDLRVENWLA